MANITNDFILKGGLKAADEAANNKLKSMDEAEMRRGQQQADLNKQTSDNDAKLTQLIKGDELKRGGDRENFQLAQDYVAQQAKEGRKVNASINGASVQQTDVDPLANWLRVKQVEDRATEKDDKAVERLSQRISKENIPGRSADFVSAEANTKGEHGGIVTDPDYVPKTSGFNQMLPDFVRGPVVSAAEKMGFMEKGSSAEMQVIQRLVNTEIKSNSGTAVSAHEQGRNDIANGMKSNNPEMVRRGVRMMKKALEMDTQNVEGSAPGHIKDQYRTQGGEYDVNKMLGGAEPTTPVGPGGKPTFEQWKAMKAGQ